MFSLPLNQEKRHILHIDADAFFASVEQVLNPKLKGKALLVGGPSGTRGIVSAASYEARKFGIHAGMPMYLATRKCPHATIVPGNFEAYRKFSSGMYSIFTKYTPEVEMASIDEAYLDITGCRKMHRQDYPEIAKSILMEVNRKLGLSVSCGLASSKVVSKVASSQNKPHKLTTVPYGAEAKFLAPLPLRAMPGIGPKTFAVLESFGFKTLGELAALSLNQVMSKFGVHGIPLWKHAQGIDDSEVISAHALPKSISKENTFYDNAVGKETALRELQELASIVFAKLRASGLRAKTICVKIRYKNNEAGGPIFKDFSFQQHLDFPTSLDNKLWPPIRKLFLKNLDQNEQLRLIGVGVTNLIQNYNLNLFDNDLEQEKLFSQIDAMKKMYGDESVKYGI